MFNRFLVISKSINFAAHLSQWLSKNKGSTRAHAKPQKHRAIFKIQATLLQQPNLTLTTARNMHAFYSYSYSENAI